MLGTPLDGGRVAVARSDDVDVDLGGLLREILGKESFRTIMETFMETFIEESNLKPLKISM